MIDIYKATVYSVKEYVDKQYEDIMGYELYSKSTDSNLIKLGSEYLAFPVNYIEEGLIDESGLLFFAFHNLITDELLDYKSAIENKDWELESRFMDFMNESAIEIWPMFISCSCDFEVRSKLKNSLKTFFDSDCDMEVPTPTAEEKEYLVNIKLEQSKEIKAKLMDDFSKKFSQPIPIIETLIFLLKPKDLFRVIK